MREFEFKGFCGTDCFYCKHFDDNPPDGCFFGYCKAFNDGFILFTNLYDGQCPKKEVISD